LEDDGREKIDITDVMLSLVQENGWGAVGRAVSTDKNAALNDKGRGVSHGKIKKTTSVKKRVKFGFSVWG